MNRVYRLVWNVARGRAVVASEHARSRSKTAGKRLRQGAGRAARRGHARHTAKSASLLALLVAALPVQAQLPTGGSVQSGAATISAPGTTSLSIHQSTPHATVHWDSFSIGAGNRVDIAQPSASSVLLNRVTGSSASEIFGSLDANGQVFLVNPNGVLFGRQAQVNVGGLVASTLDLEGPLDAWPRHFAGGSKARVTNEGTLTAMPGGYVALLGHEVINHGSIEVNQGTVALAAGSAVTLDFGGDGLLAVKVEESALDALAENHQLLRADGGQVLMSAGARDTLLASAVNHSGVIEARTLEQREGRIILLGGMEAGTTIVSGTLDASAPQGGDGGFIETSAATVQIADSARITTRAAAGRTGTWLIDPPDLTIAPSGGDITGAALSAQLADNNVTLTTIISEPNIHVNDAVSWNENRLTLNAHADIYINAEMTASGTAELELNAGFAIRINDVVTIADDATLAMNPGAGNHVRMGFNPDGTFAGRVDFPGRSGTGFLSINGNDYIVLNGLGEEGTSDFNYLQGISHNNGASYALGADIDASVTATWDGGSGFQPLTLSGRFNGLGHTVSNLHIDRYHESGGQDYGLFAWTAAGGLVNNVGVVDAYVSGRFRVGLLAGTAGSHIVNSWSTGTVHGGGAVGGLAGMSGNPISNSYSSATVEGDLYSPSTIFPGYGGLVGQMTGGTISESRATGTVKGPTAVGGLVGHFSGNAAPQILDSYATGDVTGIERVGGLVGYMNVSSLNSPHYSIIAGIYRSYATGNVTGTVTGEPYATWAPRVFADFHASSIGGLVGMLVNRPMMTDVYATGDVTGLDRVGGLIGHSNAAGSSMQRIWAEGNVTGRDWVGGLIGLQEGTQALQSAYASGNVTGRDYVGGLMGRTESLDRREPTAVQSFGDHPYLSFLYATGDVTGRDHVGGLVGRNDSPKLMGAYSVGAVSGETNVGGLVGSGSVEIHGSYWDIETSGQATSFGGTGLSTADMMLRENFSAPGPSIDLWRTSPIAGWSYLDTIRYPLLGALLRPSYQVRAADVSVTYDGQPFSGGNGVTFHTGSSAPATELDPSVYGGTPIYGGAAQGATDAGSYQLTTTGGLGALTQKGPYFTFGSGGTLTINPAPLTITANDATKVYGQTPTLNGFTPAGLVNGETVGSVTLGSIGLNSWATVAGGPYAITPSNATGGTFNPANYAITYLPGSLTVTPAPLTITAGDATKVYGETAALGFTNFTTTGLVNDEEVHIVPLASAGAAPTGGAGSHAITLNPLFGLAGVSGDFDQRNYDITFADGSLTVTPAALTVKADDATKTYGETPTLTAFTPTGLQNGETIGSVTLTSPGLAPTATVAGGPYVITASNATGGTFNPANYTITYDTGLLTVNPALLTYVANLASRPYGAANPVLGGTVAGLVNGEALEDVTTGTLAFTTSVGVFHHAVPPGYPITGSGLTLVSGNYTLAQAPGNATALTITPVPLTIRMGDATKVYGVNIPVLPDFNFTVEGLVEDLDSIDIVPGISPGIVASAGVGDYAITKHPGFNITGSGNFHPQNYDITYQSGTLTVTPAPLTITAGDATKVYGDTAVLAGGNFTPAGLVNGEIIDAVTLTSPGTAAAAPVAGGPYTITPSNPVGGGTFNPANYDITFVDGSLTITPRPLTITARDDTRTYDGNAYSGGNDVTYSGFAPGEDSTVLDGALAYGGDSQGAINTGDYVITPLGLTASNYALTFVDGTLKIVPVEITILGVGADDKTKIYGEADPELTYQLTSGALVGGDSFSGELARDPGENVGGYAIRQGTLDAGTNYVITFTNGTLSITPRPLTVEADAVSKIYGAGDPALTYQFASGTLVDGDSLSGALARDPGQNVGDYAIRQGTLDAGTNYDLSFVDGTLSITPRPLTIEADNAGKIYGEADPALTYQLTAGDLVAGDSFSGSIARAAGENAGDYAIGQGTLSAGSNYVLTYQNGTLSIAPRALTVEADDASKIYGAADPAFTYQLTAGDLVGSDSFSGALARDAGENVGGYAIGQGTLSAGSNYVLTFADGTLSITPRALTVKADDASRTYGTADPAFTYQLTAGDLVGGDSFSGTLARVAGENVGGYAIGQGTLSAGSNYTLTYQNGTLTITPALLSVRADDVSRTYGAADPALTYQLTSGALVDGDSFSGALARDAGDNVGDYAIRRGTLSAGANYTITFANGTLSIDPALLTYVAGLASRSYGEANPALGGTVEGFVNGDTQGSATTGALAFTTPANAGSNVGSYAITGSGLSANNGNYTFAQHAANATALSIDPADLTVRADDVSKAYGDLALLTDFTVTGLKNGETIDEVTLSSVGAESTASVAGGPYAITPSDAFGSTFNPANYSITYEDGVLTVTPVALTVRADDVSKTYGETPTLTAFTATGLQNGETIDSVSLASAGTAAGASVAGGPYVITASNATGGSFDPGNYTISYEDGVLTVSPATLLYLANAVARIYGETNPAFDGTVTGFVNDEDASVTSGTLVFSSATDATSNVGSYAIEGSGLSAANYTFGQAPANATALSIDARALAGLITAADKLFDGNTSAVTSGSLTGVLAGDEVGLQSSGAFTDAAVGENKTVNVNGVLDGADAGNYVLGTVNSTTTASILAATPPPDGGDPTPPPDGGDPTPPPGGGDPTPPPGGGDPTPPPGGGDPTPPPDGGDPTPPPDGGDPTPPPGGGDPTPPPGGGDPTPPPGGGDPTPPPGGGDSGAGDPAQFPALSFRQLTQDELEELEEDNLELEVEGDDEE